VPVSTSGKPLLLSDLDTIPGSTGRWNLLSSAALRDCMGSGKKIAARLARAALLTDKPIDITTARAYAQLRGDGTRPRPTGVFFQIVASQTLFA